jgi:hypothetical protein
MMFVYSQICPLLYIKFFSWVILYPKKKENRIINEIGVLYYCHSCLKYENIFLIQYTIKSLFLQWLIHSMSLSRGGKRFLTPNLPLGLHTWSCQGLRLA